MAQYKVLQKSFINGSIVEEGAIVEFDGTPHENLEPVKKAKKGAGAPDEAQQEQGAFGEQPDEAPAPEVPNGV